MNSDKHYYFLKLNPPRPTFAMDMSEDEKNIMKQHVVYWTDLMNKGSVVVFGPVLDPKSVYGIGIISAESEDKVKDFIANDPASKVNRYEYYPMRAVVPQP
jgi:uncharacterized protein YciI